MIKISILELPGSYLSAIYGIKDILEYANENFARTFDIKIISCIDFRNHPGKPDLLVLPPVRVGKNPQFPEPSSPLVKTIRKVTAKGTVPASICAGAFYLCASRIADGKTVTTHWSLAKTLAQFYPKVHVKKEKILIDEGLFISAGGITSFQDLSLFLINRYIHKEAALQTARIFLINPEDRSQLQYIKYNLDVSGSDAILSKARKYIHEHFSSDIGLLDIAKECCVTVRTLLRHFRKIADTPASYLKLVRINHARLLFESSECSVKETASFCGYADIASFSRAFTKLTGVRPGAYRKKWKLSP